MIKIKHGMSVGSEYICLSCETRQIRRRMFQKYCSQKCQMDYEYKTGTRDKNEIIKKARETRMQAAREKFKTNPTIKIGKRGYRLIYIPDRKWVKEHHYIWEQVNGKVPEGMIIHHINQNKLDNSIENLRIMTKIDHQKLHYALRTIDKLGHFTKNI